MSYGNHSATDIMFDAIRNGIEPLKIVGNDYLEIPDISFRLEPTYPWSIPNSEYLNMKFEIESGMQVPPRYKRSSLRNDMKESLGALDVGQSFKVGLEEYSKSSIYNAFHAAKKSHPTKIFVIRSTENQVNAMRIWRLE